MEYLKIRNWDKWQSYRSDRGQPPWIKIHRCVMRNCEWVSLSDAERGQLVAMWLLAADRDGVMPASPSIIQKLCFLSSAPNINKFIELGFIEGTVTSPRRQDDANMTHQTREDKTREEHTPSNGFDVFWLKYPKKVGKLAAQKAWKKLKTPNTILPIILTAIEIQKQSEQWKKDHGTYIPNPATWLNRGSWEDELSNTVTTQEPENRMFLLQDAYKVLNDTGLDIFGQFCRDNKITENESDIIIDRWIRANPEKQASQ